MDQATAISPRRPTRSESAPTGHATITLVKLKAITMRRMSRTAMPNDCERSERHDALVRRQTRPLVRREARYPAGMDRIRIVDVIDAATFGLLPPCANPGFDHRSCDYWEDRDSGSKAHRAGWLESKPAPGAAPGQAASGAAFGQAASAPRRAPTNPFAPASDERPTNPFALEVDAEAD